MTPDDGYLLDNRQAEAGVRFDALATLFDPVTVRHLSALGVDQGWRCWEVGAGGPSVPTWLADRLVAAGLATPEEIEEHLANLAAGHLDVATSPLVSAWGRRR